MHILICDDNPVFPGKIQNLLTEYFESNKLSPPEIVCYTNPDKVLSDTGVIDLLFLDMEMPEHDGIFVGNELQKTHPYTIIICVTSHPNYLDPAMHFGCFAYLGKPVDRERFFRNLGDALKKYHKQSSLVQIQTKTSIISVQTRDIILIEAQKRTSLVCTTHEEYHSLQTFSFWKQTLTQPYFYISHRSVLVSMAHITKVEKDRILMDNGQFAFLSRRNNLDFRRRYIEFYASVN